MIRRTAFVLALVTALPAQHPRTPDDAWFAFQLGFLCPPGPATLRVSSTSTATRPIAIAPGIGLDLPQAWALTTGSRSVVVAFLDDGFFWQHEDILPNVWKNPGETGLDANGLDKATNGIDDDGNGFIDDVVGWDFAFDDADPDPYVFDGMDRSRIQPYWHSISALGIVGAAGNNHIGTAGINWDVSMMLLKIGCQGEGREAAGLERVGRAARGIRYAADMGARVINWSGFVRPTAAEAVAPLREAIRYAAARQVLIVCGAGNDAKDLDDPHNAFYPQCFDEPNLLRVAELGFDGELASYLAGSQRRGSNYGKRSVEIAAVGEQFTTDLRNGQSTYGLCKGTSSAGPVVAGVAALVLAVRPDLSAADLKQILLQSATPLTALRDRVACGGTVNAARAVQLALRR